MHYTNIITRDNGILDLADNAIAEVRIEPLAPRYYAPYTEQALRYKIRLRGEKIWRRVYTTQLGNAGAVYFKSRGHEIFCERDLERQLKLSRG